jgi:hypothetical protein
VFGFNAGNVGTGMSKLVVSAVQLKKARSGASGTPPVFSQVQDF